FAGGLFTRQLHLGAFVPEIDPALRGIPTMHVEAACASGGVAVLTGAQQIMGGLRDVVLVIGAEQQKTMPIAEGADVLGAAADYRWLRGVGSLLEAFSRQAAPAPFSAPARLRPCHGLSLAGEKGGAGFPNRRKRRRRGLPHGRAPSRRHSRRRTARLLLDFRD